jgi:tetratricopeptide (TPR) repeat protein
MDAKEWAVYVDKVATGAWPVPTGMIQDKDNWICRSIVGRALLFKEDTEGAMTVLSTVLEVEPNMDDAPETGLSEAEHKTLCLKDIADIVWKLAHNAEASLQYVDEAFKLARTYKHPFRTGSRGELWYRHLELLKEAGKTEQAYAEAQKMYEEECKESHAPKQDDPNSPINPYKYFSLKFMAEVNHTKGKLSEALKLLKQAFEFYPVSKAGTKDLEAAAAVKDQEEQYKAYLHCTTIQYLPWEKLPPAVIRRNI